MKNSCYHQRQVEVKTPVYNNYTGDESIDVSWVWECTFEDIDIHRYKCTQCGDCVKVCEDDVHHLMDGKHTIDYEKCTFCGKCVEACNSDALKIVGKEMYEKGGMTESYLFPSLPSVPSQIVLFQEKHAFAS